ncbi:hypothetical protein DUNSADRAFT_9236 [Dunaliella salina]|uniref:Uncharacterized protein n=1 Tax=Dunaliella salina TaxID=3046 RepID=A0ABQ7GHW7_DUNSA|nr:hypothetical protein DUNSADRAFT_9236 [Dunaliella salina]|eukprot:KAF5834206.1 hypothetical protein DUNSADRAFT_9236 [Dunaliella salina]
MEGLQELQRHLLAGAERMAAYCGRGFLMRFLTSSSDEAHFAMLDANLQQAMQRTCFALAVEIMGSGFTPHAPSTYVDESRPLRRAICEAAGVLERLAPKAVQQLSSTQPQLLRHLLQQHGGFTAQVIATELEALGVRVDLLESRLAAIEQRISEGGNESPGLAGYLCEWWKEAIGRLKKEAPAEAFINKLVEWFQSRSIMDHLFEYEKVLQEEGLAGLVDTAASQIRQGTDWLAMPLLPLRRVAPALGPGQEWTRHAGGAEAAAAPCS